MNKSSPLSLNCRTVRKKLSAFEDREISSALRFRIEAHLAACSDCQQALADLHHLWRALEDAIPTQPQPDFSHKIMRKINEQPKSRVFNWIRALDLMFPAPIALAAMVVLGLVVGGWMGRTAIEDNMIITAPQRQSVTLEALDVFAPTPKGSLAQGYLLLVSDATQVK